MVSWYLKNIYYDTQLFLYLNLVFSERILMLSLARVRGVDFRKPLGVPEAESRQL